MHPTNAHRPFRYLADPACVGSLLLYVANRWLLKPHHVGGPLTHDYLNDLLCLPLFLPMILYAQRLVGLRRHDAPPRLWEILQHAAVFSIVFELLLPRFPQSFHTTADPLDALAYLAGGLAAAMLLWWRTPARASSTYPSPGTPGEGRGEGSAPCPRVSPRLPSPACLFAECSRRLTPP